MGRFTKKELRELFYNGITDNRGNVRLDKIEFVEDIIKRKEENLRNAFNQLIMVKRASTFLGIKFYECHVIAVFGTYVYVKCGEQIKEIGYDVLINYVKNSDIIERV